VPCDFSRDALADALANGGFDRTRPAVFAWLGVVMYLDAADVTRTLRYIATLPVPTRDQRALSRQSQRRAEGARHRPDCDRQEIDPAQFLRTFRPALYAGISTA
jgi:O-methyltransferase involved in polyketide biosynthesis